MRLDIKRLAKDRYAEYTKTGHLLDPMEADEYDEIVETAESIINRCRKAGEITPRQKETLTDVHDYLRSFGGYAYKDQWIIEDLLNDLGTWFEKDRRNGRMLEEDYATNSENVRNDIIADMKHYILNEYFDKSYFTDDEIIDDVLDRFYGKIKDNAGYLADYYGIENDLKELEAKFEEELLPYIRRITLRQGSTGDERREEDLGESHRPIGRMLKEDKTNSSYIGFYLDDLGLDWDSEIDYYNNQRKFTIKLKHPDCDFTIYEELGKDGWKVYNWDGDCQWDWWSDDKLHRFLENA